MTRALWTLGPAALSLLSAAASTVRGQDGGRTLPLSAYHKAIPLRAAKLARVTSAIAALSAPSPLIAMRKHGVSSPIDGKSSSGPMAGESPFFDGTRTIKGATSGTPLRPVLESPTFTYKPRPFALSTWSNRQVPSLGAAGVYSNSGAFTSGAGQVCQ